MYSAERGCITRHRVGTKQLFAVSFLLSRVRLAVEMLLRAYR